MLPPLPRDVLSLCCEHLRPYDIIRLTVVSTDWVDVARGKALWTAKLSEVVAAAVHGLAQPRDIEVDTALLARTRDLAWACAVQRCQHLATVVHDRTIYFHVLPHVATAAVATLSERRPRLCFVSFAQRAYDTTDFVDDHPGGCGAQSHTSGPSCGCGPLALWPSRQWPSRAVALSAVALSPLPVLRRCPSRASLVYGSCTRLVRVAVRITCSATTAPTLRPSSTPFHTVRTPTS
jgi:cytochrome b involved in lipid metabolism